jgi:hypothetical protein
VAFHERIFPGHAVDHDIEALVRAKDPPKQGFHLALLGVIDAQSDRGTAGGRDQPGGFVDGFGPAIW